MVVRLGRNGRFLACSLYPEHKESRPLPGEEEDAPVLPGVGETCPKCGATDGGTLVAQRGRFGPFVGCSRYPDCDYIKREGPPPPEPLPFEVACPRCGEGRLTPRRARRTGSAVLGLLALPQVRLHDLARAARRPPRRRRRAGCPEGRGRRDVPEVRGDDGRAGGVDRRPAAPSTAARPTRPRWPARRAAVAAEGRAGAESVREPGPAAGTRSSRSTSGRRPTGRRRGTERAPGA